jgi:hypothetical protein
VTSARSPRLPPSNLRRSNSRARLIGWEAEISRADVLLSRMLETSEVVRGTY